jgi:hypothetical protein
LFGCHLVPAFLHQNVNGISILVYGPPKIMQLAVNLDEHLIELPSIT